MTPRCAGPRADRPKHTAVRGDVPTRDQSSRSRHLGLLIWDDRQRGYDVEVSDNVHYRGTPGGEGRGQGVPQILGASYTRGIATHRLRNLGEVDVLEHP